MISKDDFDLVVPLVYELNQGNVPMDVLKLRFDEMKHQNYKCAGVFIDRALVGVSGLWFCTRHYTGKSVELDHVYIKPEFRGKGLGKQFMDWIGLQPT